MFKNIQQFCSLQVLNSDGLHIKEKFDKSINHCGECLFLVPLAVSSIPIPRSCPKFTEYQFVASDGDDLLIMSIKKEFQCPIGSKEKVITCLMTTAANKFLLLGGGGVHF
jgi:hypothetical protein